MGPNRKKWQQVFLSSKYHLHNIKTICQDYTQKYDKIEFVYYRVFAQQCLYCAKTRHGTTKKW